MPRSPGLAAAQEITGFTAKPAGTVDARGRRTTWYFEYGPSTFYGFKTAAKSGGSSFGAKAVSAGISGLRPSVTYHYRLVAVNDAGTSRGADVTFTTVGVTVAASVQAATFGQAVVLSGAVPLKKQGEVVQLFAQRVRQGLAAADRDAGHGRERRLELRRHADDPDLLPRKLAGRDEPRGRRRRQACRVVPRDRAEPLRDARHGEQVVRRRIVKLQRLTARGTWVTVKRVRLDRHGAARFRATLPQGRSTLRIAMSVNQAGAGYLAGFSRTIVYRRA